MVYSEAIKIKPPKKQIITSWNLHESTKMLVVTPDNYDELLDCINFAKKNNLKIAIKGGGNSFSGVNQYDGQLLVDVKNLNSIKSFDAKNGIIEVESGLRIGNLLSTILPKNWNVVGISGSLNDTIGGMISGNTHGKDSWKNGNFGHNVISLKILLADGKTIEINEASYPEFFNGVIAGLGFLGIVFEVKLKLTPIPSYMVEVTYNRISNFNDLFEKFYSFDETGVNFSYATLDPFASNSSMGRGIMESARYMNKNTSSENELRKSLIQKSKINNISPEKFWFLFRIVWGYEACKLMNKVRYLRAGLKKKSVIVYGKYQYPLESTLPKLNLLYAPKGFIEFHCLFEKENVLEAFKDLLLCSKRINREPWICGVKRHISDSSHLSFQGDGLGITMNFPLKYFSETDVKKYTDELLKIILHFEGKVYLSKNSVLPKDAFQKMYPKYKKMIELKKKYDPDNLFLSNATKRLLID